MINKITNEEGERESRWEKFKTQLHFWVLAFDYDPLEDTHKRANLLNTEVGRLQFRVEALELQLSPPTPK